MAGKDTGLDVNLEFAIAEQFKVISNIKKSHRVARGKFINSVTSFVLKEISDPASARLEQLAQEFFRLIIPHQPETYLVENQATGVYYILSQEVADYKPLPTGEANKFKENGDFTGLGQVCLVSLFLEETDLKNGNLGLNNENQVIKIDGDRCFFELNPINKYTKQAYKISPRGISQLPFPQDFYAYNWLDLIYEGVTKSASSIVTPDLSNSPKFRAEVNQAMLRICLLPDAFLEAFVDAYLPAGGQRYLTFLAIRRNELRASALTNDSFVDYINSPASAKDIEQFIAHLKSFKTKGISSPAAEKSIEKFITQLTINSEKVVNTSLKLEDRIKANRQEMQWQLEQAKKLIVENIQLIGSLRAMAVPGKNADLDNYLVSCQQKLKSSGQDPARLFDVKNNLAKKLLLFKEPKNSQQSDELMAKNHDLIKKIRSIVPPGQISGLDATLDDYWQKTQLAWLDPESLKTIHKSLELMKIHILLKQECELLLQELQNYKGVVVTPKLIEDLKTADLNQLPLVKKELIKQHAMLKDMLAIQANIDYIRSRVSAITAPLLHNRLKTFEAYMSKGSADPDSLKGFLLECNAMQKSVQLMEECKDLLKQLETYHANPQQTKMLADKLAIYGYELEKLVALKGEIQTNVRIASLKVEILGNLNILASYSFGNNDLLLAQYIREKQEQVQNNSQNLEILTEVEKELAAALAPTVIQSMHDMKAYIEDLQKRGHPYAAMADQHENTLASMPFGKRGAFIKEQLEKNTINSPKANITVSMKERLAQMRNTNPPSVPAQPPILANIQAARGK